MEHTGERPQTQRIRIEQHSAIGMLWFGAWLFTIGFLHLSFWKAVLALLVWPYYLGTALAPLLRSSLT
jgi:hypothetical protein